MDAEISGVAVTAGLEVLAGTAGLEVAAVIVEVEVATVMHHPVAVLAVVAVVASVVVEVVHALKCVMFNLSHFAHLQPIGCLVRLSRPARGVAKRRGKDSHCYRHPKSQQGALEPALKF